MTLETIINITKRERQGHWGANQKGVRSQKRGGVAAAGSAVQTPNFRVLLARHSSFSSRAQTEPGIPGSMSKRPFDEYNNPRQPEKNAPVKVAPHKHCHGYQGSAQQDPDQTV